MESPSSIYSRIPPWLLPLAVRLAVLLPLLFLAGIATAPTLVLCVWAAIFAATSRDERMVALREGGRISVLIGIPLSAAALFTPARAVMMVSTYLPESWESVDNALAAYVLFPGPIFETVIALSGLFLGVVIFVTDFFWRLAQYRQIQNLPQSKARAAAMGLAEFQGTALPLQAFDKKPIFASESHLIGAKDQAKPFWLTDETGHILVDPRTARIRPLHKWFLFGRQTCEIILTRRVRFDSVKVTWNQSLESGDHVYVMGQVSTVPNPPPVHLAVAGVKAGDLMVAPSPEALKPEDITRVFYGRLFGGPRRDIHDVFVIADSAEAAARTQVARGIVLSALSAVLWIALSAFLLFGHQAPPDWYANAGVYDPYTGAAGRGTNESELVRQLKNGSSPMRRHVIELLSEKPAIDRSTVDALVYAMRNDPAAHIRSSSLRALRKHGAPVSTILYGMSDTDAAVRAAAIGAAGKYKNSATEVVPHMLVALQDTSPEVRKSAAWVLRDMAGNDTAVTKAVLRLLRDTDAEVRSQTLTMVSVMKSDTRDTLPLYAELATNPDKLVRERAVIGLGTLGTAARGYASLLTDALQDTERRVRYFAMQGLREMNAVGADAVPGFIYILENDDRWERLEAIGLLKTLGSEAAPAIPALRKVEKFAGTDDVKKDARHLADTLEADQ